MTISQDKDLLSIQPYRGTRDFFPDVQRKRNRLFHSWKKVLMSFGFEEYDAPLLEPLELYAAKSSEEIVSTQLYSFVDRGERHVALRPEMTPTLARMVASKMKQIPRPIRWFSIPRCMRYERPQRGRLREFDQLNVDVFGGSPQEEDLEILLVCAQIMKELEAQSDWYLIQMNDRRITTDMLVTGAKLHADQIKNAIALIDKRDKIKPEEFKTQWNAMATRGTQSDAAIALGESKFLEHQQLFIKEFEEVLGKVQGNKSNAFFKSWLEQSSKDTAFNLSEAGKDALRNLLEIQDCFQRLMPDVKIEIDLSIARGFDYYTGIVFEVFDTHPENKRALFGGGRYDNLVGAFVQDKLPGVGFGVSDVSLLNFCEVHNIELDRGQNVDVAVARFSPEDRLVALELSALLRTQGLNCISPIADVKFGKQIQSAEKAGAIAVAFRGADEIQANTFAVKWLKTGEQENDFPFSEAGVLRLKGKLLQEKN